MDSGLNVNAWINLATLVALLWGIVGVFRKLGSREQQFDTMIEKTKELSVLVQLHDKEIAVLQNRVDTIDEKVCNE